jgi:transcriptional regulator with XRE-family HTH domain
MPISELRKTGRVVGDIEIRRPQDLGLAVSEARRMAGLTQAQLSDDSGVDRTYLAKLEAGLTTLLLDRSIRLLRRLGARLVVELPTTTQDSRDDEKRPARSRSR